MGDSIKEKHNKRETMKRYKIALFDLDGTLTDSATGITNSIMYALARFDIQVQNRECLYPFIGPPLLDSFMKYYHFSYEQAKQACEDYHEYFCEKGIFENQVYHGVPEMLTELRNRGMTLAIASAKPEYLVKRILCHFHLSDFFHFIGGADASVQRIHKSDVIEYTLNAFQNLPKKEIVMIGDREDDITGAKTHQLDSVGVLYGFGSRRELEAAGAVYLIESVNELCQKLINGF